MTTPSGRTKKLGQQLRWADELGQLIHTWLLPAAACIIAGWVMPSSVLAGFKAQFSAPTSASRAAKSSGLMWPAWKEWNTSCTPRRLVLAIQFRVAAIDADQGAAAHALDAKHAGAVPGRAVREVARRARGIAGAEPLVVPVHDPSLVADDVEAVVRLVGFGQPVRRAEDHPETQLGGEREHVTKSRRRAAASRSPRGKENRCRRSRTGMPPGNARQLRPAPWPRA